MTAPGVVGRLRRTGRYARQMLRDLAEHARRADSRASLTRRVSEQGRLLLLNNVTARDYYLYELDRPDLPWDRKREFLGRMDRLVWEQELNSAAYVFFSRDKLVAKRYLAHAGLPVARLLGVVGPTGRSETGQPLRTPDELRRWLSDTGVEQAVFKPVLGSRGADVLILGQRVDKSLEWERVPRGRIDFDTIVAHVTASRYDHFLVEERLRPHPDLAVFGAEVLHTARIVTILKGEVDVIVAVLRIGTGAGPTDNFSQENLAAPIDLPTGRLGTAVAKWSRTVRYRHHPVTGAPVEGYHVPDWDRALAVVRAAARVLPFHPAEGWDLGFTDRGPVIVEINALWDMDIVQRAPDRGLLATPFRDYLDARGLTHLIGLWSPSCKAPVAQPTPVQG